MFPVGTCAHRQTHTEHICVCTWLATEIAADVLGTHARPLFLCFLMLGKLSMSLALPTFDAFSKHSISLVQRQNAVPLHTLWQRPPLPKVLLRFAAIDSP